MDRIQQLENRIAQLEKEFNSHRHLGSDNLKVDFKHLSFGAGSTLTKPTGGATVDTQARTAISAIIDLLKTNRMIK